MAHENTDEKTDHFVIHSTAVKLKAIQIVMAVESFVGN